MPPAPPTGVTLLLGGARSGKSDLAVRLAGAWGGPVTFVATASPDGDDDLSARIARHRTERPPWPTVEAPRDLAVVDGLDEDGANAVADELLAALRSRHTPSLVVTNEVGMGVHPSSPLGREYRDVLGRVNRRLGEGADRALLVAAGRVLPLLRAEDAFA
jgi:adenosyl cobinamide kinase/adenosyl cobinamide phosphate guanylyltransferase